MNRLAVALLAAAPLALAQKPHTRTTPEAPTTHLPVTSVSLYKNGVGFFEHTGTITGDAAVTIDFTDAQLNDVLQSLTAIDRNGGRISGAGYNSTTPLDQQLKTLPLALDADPTALAFYNAIRGARVQVTAPGIAITGRLLSMESRTTTLKPGDDASPTSERQFFTVVSDEGTARTLELTPLVSIRLLDTALHTDVTRYLQLIDANRNHALRHLTLNDRGTGARELSLSYISEVPIWKSTYRILFTDNPPTGVTYPDGAKGGIMASGLGLPTATLQGWSVVDNTTGTDWINVHLALIAGAPQSFIQPISQPIYSRRPEIPIAQEAQLTPQTFDSSIDGVQTKSRTANVMGMAGMSAGAPGGVASGMALGSGSGPVAVSRSYGISAGGVMNIAAAPQPTYEDAATASLTTRTTAAAFDDFFAYNLTEPVTIRTNESALVPILQAKVPAERVTVVSSNGFATQQPLRALWLTNASGLTLDRGSFSIVENGNFGGEGLLDAIHPGEKRLLSYAADQAIHVAMEGANTTQRIVSITAAKGVLRLHNAEAHEITYVVHNASTELRTVVVEQPVVRGFVLDSTSPNNTDPKPDETTPTVYRFRLVVAPGDTARLHTGARRRGTTTYQLTNADDNQLTYILQQTGNNPQLEAALQPILEARRRVAAAQTAVDQTNTRLTALRADEDRQRANVTALATADKSSRQRFVADLNHTEDDLKSTQAELATRTTALDAAHADLSNRITTLQLDETL